MAIIIYTLCMKKILIFHPKAIEFIYLDIHIDRRGQGKGISRFDIFRREGSDYIDLRSRDLA